MKHPCVALAMSLSMLAACGPRPETAPVPPETGTTEHEAPPVEPPVQAPPEGAPAAATPDRDDTVRQAAEHFLRAYAGARVEDDTLSRRDFDPDSYWDVLLPILEEAPERFTVAEIGRSVMGRPLRRIDFGDGDIPVLLWSQMHGNESTATRALVDVLRYLRDNAGAPRVQRIHDRLAITVVPLLNPDGAALFRRENAVGIDINRDARRLATPEARALKGVRDDVDARWGFNLHDQNVRTRLGDSGRDVLIALLAPPPGPGETSPANRRARQMCSLVARALQPVAGDQVARYDESFNPRAFGDLMTSWGTSVVLIESGGEITDPGKERLRTANFVAILTALDAIATGTWDGQGEDRYLSLPLNSPWIHDVIVRGASIVLPDAQPVRADLAIDFADTLMRDQGRIQEVGDLEEAAALEEIDASGLYFHPDPGALGPNGQIGPGAIATGAITRDPQGLHPILRLDAGNVSPADEGASQRPAREPSGDSTR